MVLSVRTWSLCQWMTGKYLSQYVPGLSADGKKGDGSLWTYLDSLLVEDMERVPSVQPGLSVMEDREMLQDRYVS